jgi:CubicO group peptidase (beta-lactamase class C family)
MWLVAGLAGNRDCSAAAPAPQPPATILADKPQDLASMLDPIRAKYKLPGMVAAVLQGERITAIGACGVRKIGDPALFTAQDIVHLGSCTKAMTATLIARLVDQEKLSWDMPMSEALPALASTMNPEAAKITVAQLLNHTSGLPANAWYGLYNSENRLPELRLAIPREALSKKPVTPPGRKSEYSNLGYIILGAILEQKRGKPW